MQIVVHLGQDLGKRGEGLHAGVPGLHVGAIGDLVGGGVALGLQPVICAHHLRWVSGRSEHLGHQSVWIEGYGGDHLLKLFRGQRLGRSVAGLGWRVARLGIIRVIRLIQGRLIQGRLLTKLGAGLLGAILLGIGAGLAVLRILSLRVLGVRRRGKSEQERQRGKGGQTLVRRRRRQAGLGSHVPSRYPECGISPQ